MDKIIKYLHINLKDYLQFGGTGIVNFLFSK